MGHFVPCPSATPDHTANFQKRLGCACVHKLNQALERNQREEHPTCRTLLARGHQIAEKLLRPPCAESGQTCSFPPHQSTRPDRPTPVEFSRPAAEHRSPVGHGGLNYYMYSSSIKKSSQKALKLVPFGTDPRQRRSGERKVILARNFKR